MPASASDVTSSQRHSLRHGSNSELRSATCEDATHAAEARLAMTSPHNETPSDNLASINTTTSHDELEFNPDEIYHKKFRMHRKRKLPPEVPHHQTSIAHDSAEDSAPPSSPESVVVDDVTSSEDELRAINSPCSRGESPLEDSFEPDSPVEFTPFTVKEINEVHACQWLQCSRTFSQLVDLVNHVNDEHVRSDRDVDYKCYWNNCPRKGKGFNARYKMLIHVRTHTNERPYKCTSCSKSFSRLENLKIHIRSHTGERPYLCPFEGCNKAYSNSSDRFKHVRTHQEQKPYSCRMPGCDKRYTDPSSLRKHIKTHGHFYKPAATSAARGANVERDSVARAPVHAKPHAHFSPCFDARLSSPKAKAEAEYAGRMTQALHESSSMQEHANWLTSALTFPRMPLLPLLSDPRASALHEYYSLLARSGSASHASAALESSSALRHPLLSPSKPARISPVFSPYARSPSRDADERSLFDDRAAMSFYHSPPKRARSLSNASSLDVASDHEESTCSPSTSPGALPLGQQVFSPRFDPRMSNLPAALHLLGHVV